MLETTEPSVAPNDTLHRYSTLVDRIRPLSGHESVLVIDAARSPLTCLPFQSESLPALVVSDLQDAAPDVLDVALAELARVAMRFVFVAVETGDKIRGRRRSLAAVAHGGKRNSSLRGLANTHCLDISCRMTRSSTRGRKW